MDAAEFCRCCALLSSNSLSPEERRAQEAALLQVRRLPNAAQVCGGVLLQPDPTAAFHAAITLKYSTSTAAGWMAGPDVFLGVALE
eukprot:Skav226238  [mRNA]  locus=scaffold1218:443241:444959:- [translate_table: standard]